jgi:SOS response regulatory protein OraA/RecX
MTDAPRVTELRFRRGSRRCDIFLDEEFWRSTTRNVAKDADIYEGALVSADLESRLLELERGDARARALRLLALRERSASELRTRLGDDGYPATIVEQTVARLVETRLVDDTRFAEAMTRSALAKGHGSRRIVRALAAKGVQDELVADLLASLAPGDDSEKLALDAALRFVRTSDTPDRLAARLVRRGHSPSDALGAASAVLHQHLSEEQMAGTREGDL